MKKKKKTENQEKHETKRETDNKTMCTEIFCEVGIALRMPFSIGLQWCKQKSWPKIVKW